MIKKARAQELLARPAILSAFEEMALRDILALHERVERLEEAATLALSDLEVAFKPHTDIIELIRLGTDAALRLRATLKETTHD